MKENRVENRRGRIITILATVLVIAFAVGFFLAYEKLRGLYLEQCVITDMDEQVSITSGKMVKADVIAENLDLRPGANLALIDFDEKRAELLKKIPNIRAITITRRLPDRVTVVSEERTPIARLAIRGSRKTTGRVVDSEGVVFVCQRGTQLLPQISEPQGASSQPGSRLADRARAALQVLEVCREPGFSELTAQDIDITRPDYLLITLGNYSKVKLSWEGMDSASRQGREDLLNRLRNLVHAIRSQVAPEVTVWNATIPDRIFADTQKSLQ